MYEVKSKYLLIISSVVFILFILYTCQRSSPQQKADAHNIVPLTKHWEKAIPHQEIPEGLASLTAESCGSCHQEIYKEWKQSTHAVAFQDLQFQAEWTKDNTYVCLNCHTPLQNQQEFIITGLIDGDHKNPVKEPNPQFDQKLQLESITCASCHVRNGVVIGTIGTDNAPHKTLRDTVFLSEQLCIGCHNVVGELNPVLVCTFETGDEWQNNWASKQGLNCISCHMTAMERQLVPNGPRRRSHFHGFPGSGIPKFYHMEVTGLESLEITEGSVKPRYAVGEKLKYTLALKNSFAGHKVPTGDPERFFMVNFSVLDETGGVLKQLSYRIGEEWQWHPIAKKISDNNLNPLEERAFEFEYEIPAKNNLTLTVGVSKHRITKENAEYNGILGKYPLFIEVYQKEYEMKIYK